MKNGASKNIPKPKSGKRPCFKTNLGELLGQERQHLDTVNQILSGTVPPLIKRVPPVKPASPACGEKIRNRHRLNPKSSSRYRSLSGFTQQRKVRIGVYDTVILNAGKRKSECFKSHSKRRTGTRGKTVSIHETARRLQRPITRKKKLIWEA